MSLGATGGGEGLANTICRDVCDARWRGGRYMPTTTLMSAWFEALLDERPDDMKWIERGRRTIVAMAISAGW